MYCFPFNIEVVIRPSNPFDWRDCISFAFCIINSLENSFNSISYYSILCNCYWFKEGIPLTMPNSLPKVVRVAAIPAELPSDATVIITRITSGKPILATFLTISSIVVTYNLTFWFKHFSDFCDYFAEFRLKMLKNLSILSKKCNT
jgi:hypothetical protein